VSSSLFLKSRFIVALLLTTSVAPATWAANTGFTPQTRVGFTTGDQWEPAIAADGYGHVYVLYPQYVTVPRCPNCPVPTMILTVSNDNGNSWEAPRQIAPPGTGQFDAQIVVDPADHRTVYAAWLQNNKSDTVVAKSADFGQSWSLVIADSTNAETDKPVLAVHGTDVYVGFNHAQKVWVASSHDGGITFTSANVNGNAKLGWSLAGGGTVDPAGNVYFAWAGYTRNGGAKGPVNLYASKSSDGGKTWTSTLLDISAAPPDCSDHKCGWAYLGAQITMSSDAAGTLFALWNSGSVAKGRRFCRRCRRGACFPRDCGRVGRGRSHRLDGFSQRTTVEHLLPQFHEWWRDLVGCEKDFQSRAGLQLHSTRRLQLSLRRLFRDRY